MTGDFSHQRQVETALQSGAYFRAYDLALQGLDADPGSLSLAYCAVLSLARAGAVRHARARLDRLLASQPWGPGLPAQLEEDIHAMDARLFKDLALEAAGEKRREFATEAAIRYEKAATTNGAYFPLINAATMWCLADDASRSRALASNALESALHARDAYWSRATAAEAYLLLGNIPDARAALAAAVSMPTAELAQKAVTRKQLRVVCDKLGIPNSVIDVVPQQIIACYRAQASTMGRVPRIDSIKERIAAFHEERRFAVAFGVIRCEAELILTEALIELGIATEFVLPVAPARIAEAIGDQPKRLQDRLQRCIEGAQAFSVVNENGVLSAALSAHSARCAAGVALLRAQHLLIETRRISLSSRGGITLEAGRRSSPDWPADQKLEADQPSIHDGLHGEYQTKAFVFCDIRGFSTIPDGQMLDFANVVLGGLASIVADYKEAVEYKETAGDCIYLVLTDVTVAAACALRLLDRMSQVSTGAFSRLGIRISAHIGTALAATDPVTGLRKFFGSEVIRAARMEPITPVGECYVTEQFAGVLALECSGQYLCEYAGTLESANGFGAFRMYSLRRLSRG